MKTERKPDSMGFGLWTVEPKKECKSTFLRGGPSNEVETVLVARIAGKSNEEILKLVTKLMDDRSDKILNH